MANLATMSSLEITKSMPCFRLTTRLASLPREVPDMVYRHIFSNAEYTVGFGKRYYIQSPGNRAIDALLILIHEEALRSRLARELCQAFWYLKFSQYTLDVSWIQLPDLCNPGLVTIMETTKRESKRTLYGAQPTIWIPLITMIRPRDLVTGLEINVNDNKELDMSDTSDLQRLSHHFAAALRFPRLRRLEINFWVPRDCDCYWEAMPLVETISDICAILHSRIGHKLSVWIMRDWPHHRSTFKFMDHDISWMWGLPGQKVRMIQGARLPTAAEDQIRTLISSPKVPKRSLLEELRNAASTLPQRRVDIAAEEGGWKGKD